MRVVMKKFVNGNNLAAWRGHIAAGMVTAALTVGMIAGGSLALWGIGGGCLLFALAWLTEKKCPPRDWRIIGFCAVFAALVLAADFTALAPERSWAMSARVLSAMIPLALLFHAARQPVQWPRWFDYAAWAVLGVTLVLLTEFLTHGGVLMPWFHFKHDDLVYYDRGLCYAAVLIWPLLAQLAQQRRWRLAAALWLALAVTSWCSASRGAPLALAVGTVFAGLAWWLPRLARLAAVGVLAVMAAGILMAVPWLFAQHADWLGHLPVSWQHRFEIWDYLMLWGRQAPWVGHGLDAAGVVPIPVPPHAPYLYATGAAAHPHHGALQLWLELGPLGWLWAVGLALYILARMRRWHPISYTAGMAAWAGYVTLVGGAFSLWADSFLALAAMTIFWLAQIAHFPARRAG